MSSEVFFIFSSFLFSSVFGAIVSRYISFFEELNLIVLKGPWNVTVGIFIMIGFYIYHLRVFYKSLSESFLRIIYEIISLCVMVLIFCFITGFSVSSRTVLSAFVVNFTISPLLDLYKGWCDGFFNGRKYKNEKVLLFIILFIFIALVFIDFSVYILNKYR